MLDNVLLTRVIVQPTEKPRSVGSHKPKLKTTTDKTKSHLKNKKFRSVSTQLREGSTEPDSDGKTYFDNIYSTWTKIRRNIHCIDIDPLIPIVTWKLRIAHISLVIDSLLVIYHILGIIRGPNLTLNRQEYQWII